MNKKFSLGLSFLSLLCYSSLSAATLTVSVSSSGAAIGTLTNNGGGKYSRTFTSVASNPVKITVKSNKGGSASRTVVAN